MHGAEVHGASSRYLKDGVATALCNAGTYSDAEIYIRAAPSGTAYGYVGELFSALFINRILTSGELSDVSAYMAARAAL